MSEELAGEFPPLEKTGIRCECGFTDMQFFGMTERGYPKYRCPVCRSKTDRDPKNEALRMKIDRKLPWHS